MTFSSRRRLALLASRRADPRLAAGTAEASIRTQWVVRQNARWSSSARSWSTSNHHQNCCRDGSSRRAVGATTVVPFSTAATTSSAPIAAAAAAQDYSPDNTTTRWFEVFMASLVAFGVSAALVVAFPQASAEPASASAAGSNSSTTTTTGTAKAGPQVSFRRNKGSAGGSGGGNNNNSGGGGGDPNGAIAGKQVKRSDTKDKPAVTDHGKQYDISVRAIKGGRLTMEDRYFVARGGKFSAVFDGHGGADVSTYLRDSLYCAVKDHLNVQYAQEKDEEIAAVPSVSSQVAALRAGFFQVEKHVMADDRMQYQGSTAVAVVVHESEDGHRTLLSANVGDSRAILSRRGRAVDLTRDHKPSDEREKARILAMGETIEWDNFSKVHRVRNLSLSRAIGDRYAKPAVSPEVEIKHFSVVDTDEFVLLASDGLWDVMTSQEVVTFVHDRLDSEMHHLMANQEGGDAEHFIRENMAKFVAREAIRRGSGDNICVVMVFLNDFNTMQPAA